MLPRNRPWPLSLGALRGIGLAVAGLCWSALAVPLPAWGVEKEPTTTAVNLVVSNLRYCRQAPCSVTDSAYLRGPLGPLTNADNPAVFVDVAPGDTVTWAYQDELCDTVQCAGHEVRFENGTPEGTASLGFLDTASGSARITWTVPADAAPGTVWRYFCAIETHWKEGLTGALRVGAR